MKLEFIERYSALESPLHRLDARVKILSFIFLAAVCVSTPPNAYLSFAGYFLFITVAGFVSQIPFSYFLIRLLVVIPFVLMVGAFLPFMDPASTEIMPGDGQLFSQTGMEVFRNLIMKSLIAVLSIILLVSSTTFPKILQGFEQLRVPRIFIMLTAFAYRYIFVLVDEVKRMKRARDSRCFKGRWLWHSKVIGQMIGTLFLRSYERAERVYMAMISRGFEGKPMGLGATELKAKDYAFAVCAFSWVLFLRISAV